MDSSTMDINKHSFPKHINETGKLVFLEATRDIPFEIKRVYYLYSIDEGKSRGFHAHKNLKQVYICIHGKCEVLLDDGKEKTVVILDDPSEGLYIGNVIWREIYNFSSDAVLLVLASDYFDEQDYIRSYGDFIKYLEETK